MPGVSSLMLDSCQKGGAGMETRPASNTYKQKPGGALFELTLQPRLAINVGEGLQDLELTIGLGFADVDVLRQMHVLLRGDLATGAIEGETGLERGADLIHFERTGLLDRSLPQVHAVIAQHHGRAGDAAFLDETGRRAFGEPSLEIGDKLLVGRGVDRLEVGPATELAH